MMMLSVDFSFTIMSSTMAMACWALSHCFECVLVKDVDRASLSNDAKVNIVVSYHGLVDLVIIM